jgi:hypothetical protein
MVYSRVGDEFTIPILDYENIGENGKFNVSLRYHLEKSYMFALIDVLKACKYTYKIPIKIKNLHRKFWGFKPLKNKMEVL